MLKASSPRPDSRSRTNQLVLVGDLVVFGLISLVVSVGGYGIPIQTYLVQLGPTLVVLAIALYLFSVFEITLEAPLSSLIARAMLAVLTALMIILTIIYFLGPGSGRDVYGRGVLLISLGAFSLYLLVTRILRFRHLRSRTPFVDWVFFGSEDKYLLLNEEVNRLSRHRVSHQDQDGLRLALESGSGKGVILGDQLAASDEVAEMLLHEKFTTGRISTIDLFYENFLGKVPIFHVKDRWFIDNAGFGVTHNSIRQRVKRTLDVTLVIVSAPLTLLVCSISSLLVLAVDRTNPVFTQKRVGLHGREFRIYKLKTMKSGNDSGIAEWTGERDPRITTLGNVLRKYRLDEVPQLLNVLKGDMSIVGPRPEQKSYTAVLEKEIPYYDLRHSLKPGITGWAQVRYPYGASVKDSRIKLEYDLYYIKNYSVLLDLSILMKTVYTVISGGGR